MPDKPKLMDSLQINVTKFSNRSFRKTQNKTAQNCSKLKYMTATWNMRSWLDTHKNKNKNKTFFSTKDIIGTTGKL